MTLLTEGKIETQPAKATLDLKLSLRVASGLYSITADNLPLKGSGFATVEPVATTGTLCIAGCTATVEGFFAGSDLSRAGIAFSVHNPALSKHINGIAAFKRD